MVRYTHDDLNDLLRQAAEALGIMEPGQDECPFIVRDFGGKEREVYRKKPGGGYLETHIRGDNPTMAKMLMAVRDFGDLAKKLHEEREAAFHAAHDDGLAVMTMMITYDPERFGDDKQVNDMAGRVHEALRARNVDVLDYRYFTNGLDEGDRDSLALAMQRREAIANGDT